MSVLHLMSHFCVNIYVTGGDGLSGCTLLSTVEVVTTSLHTSNSSHKYCLCTVHRKHKKVVLISCFMVREHSLTVLKGPLAVLQNAKGRFAGTSV